MPPEMIEEESHIGNVTRRQRHMVISRRDTLANDLKNSTTGGLISLLLGVLSLLLCLFSIYISYRSQGNAGYFVGGLLVLSLLLAIGGVAFSVAGYRDRSKIRHVPERWGMILSVFLIFTLIALYVLGVMNYFGK